MKARNPMPKLAKLTESEYDELLSMIQKYGATMRDSGLPWTEGTDQFGRIVKWAASRTDFGFSGDLVRTAPTQQSEDQVVEDLVDAAGLPRPWREAGE